MGTCFFIVGSGRCGSTALYLLLKDHPCVALTNEARGFELRVEDGSPFEVYHNTALSHPEIGLLTGASGGDRMLELQSTRGMRSAMPICRESGLASTSRLAS